MKNLYSFIFLLIATAFYSQTIQGKIISNETKEPLSFVKIGVESEKVGVISDQDGNFILNLENVDSKKNVMVEVAGYEIFKTSVSNFTKSNPQTIILREKIQQIAEVKINPKKLVDKNWGINTKTKSIMYSVNPERMKEQAAHELALGFETKKRAKIQKINMNIARIEIDRPVVINYVIYSSKNGTPAETLIENEIKAEMTLEKILDNTFSIDVSDENIWVNGEFFIGVQFMNDFKGYVSVSASPFRAGFLRSFYGDWEKVSIVAPAINIDVKVDKNYKNIEEEAKKENEKEEKRFLNDFNNLEKFKDEALKSKFGNNKSAGKYFKTGDVQMYYEIYGKGEPLFLLHGNSGNIQAFYKQIEELSKHFKVIAVDTRAQGNSKDLTTANFTYELFANDLKNLADHLQIKKASIIGWSDGGNIGLNYAMKNPDNIDKLIAIGANTNPNGVAVADFESMKVELEKQIKNSPDNINSIRLLRLMIEEPNLTKADLEKIKNPTLIVAGERDIILESHTKEIANSIPNAQLKIVKDATHSLIQEKPDEFNSMAIKFLKKGKL